VERVDVEGAGAEIRNHPLVGPGGANADFLCQEPDADGWYSIRTYERGVEEETLACGTGCAASGVVLALNGAASPIHLRTRGGHLKVHLERDGDSVRNIWLEGLVDIIFRGAVVDI
ncbi:diaminopimelate epimerase, partial [Candidatus Zixiibacteriota bacterium]